MIIFLIFLIFDHKSYAITKVQTWPKFLKKIFLILLVSQSDDFVNIIMMMSFLQICA